MGLDSDIGEGFKNLTGGFSSAIKSAGSGFNGFMNNIGSGMGGILGGVNKLFNSPMTIILLLVGGVVIIKFLK